MHASERERERSQKILNESERGTRRRGTLEKWKWSWRSRNDVDTVHSHINLSKIINNNN